MQTKTIQSVRAIIISAGLILCCMIWICSCSKFIHVKPPITRLVSNTVFQSDETAVSAICGIYSDMIGNSGFASGDNHSITVLAGLSSDELINYSNDADQIQFYQNSLRRGNTYIEPFLWAPAYKYIYAANAIIEGVAGSGQMSSGTKRQLTGEALFVRAFCNFYLVNLFGDIPLILTSDYSSNAIAPRTPKTDVYRQMILDLKQAQDDLAIDYSASGGERVRPNKWAATALLARIYLYIHDWADAEEESTAVINHSDLYKLTENLNDVFLANSQEAIWQLEPVIPGLNTNEGFNFILSSRPNYEALTDSLVYCFEPGDQRRDKWIDSIVETDQTFYYSFKYKVQSSEIVSEYSMVLRLAEQYLIRAEARAWQNKIDDAKSDLNIIRNRAGLPNFNANDKTSVITAILHERRVELFAEWGHRWLDLQRMGLADSALGSIKPQWRSTSILYPIPQSEIQNDPNLSQNDGY